jgi:hypothetical protein
MYPIQPLGPRYEQQDEDDDVKLFITLAAEVPVKNCLRVVISLLDQRKYELATLGIEILEDTWYRLGEKIKGKEQQVISEIHRVIAKAYGDPDPLQGRGIMRRQWL